MKKIIKQLLSYYKEHYEFLSNNDMNTDKTLLYLKDNYLDTGICTTCINLLDYNPSSDKWVRNNDSPNFRIWFTQPYECSTKAGMLVCLKYRIDKMEEILKNITPWYYKLINRLFKTNYL